VAIAQSSSLSRAGTSLVIYLVSHNSSNFVFLSHIEKIIFYSHIFEDISLATYPRVIYVFPKSNMLFGSISRISKVEVRPKALSIDFSTLDDILLLLGIARNLGIP